MTRPLDQLMQKEMTRKEFMMTLGLGLASIVGFSTIIHMLTGKSFTKHISQNQSGSYGSTAYGGGKE